MESLQGFITSITSFISNVVLPLLFTVALLFFIWNVFRFFIYGATDHKAQENAKQLAIYGIGALVFLVSLWGIVNLLISGFGLEANDYVKPDIMTNDPLWRESDFCRRNPGLTDCR